MRAAVVTMRNPFDPLDRQVTAIRRPRRIRALTPRVAAPVICLLNGRPLLRAGWRRKLRDGDTVAFVVLPRGGGGGAGGSDPLRTVLSLALMAFAPWAGGALMGGAAGTVLFGSFTLGQAAGLGIMLAGQAVINALLPPPRAQVSPAASPTYSLQAQGNMARIEQAIPVQYGRLLAYPDLAAQPYAEFAGDEQYLLQLFCLGAGDYDIDEIRIEDTPIAAFAEITTEIVPPGAEVTLFPTNVITSPEVSGQELTGRTSGTWSRTTTTVTVTQVAHGRAVGQALSLHFTTGGGPDGAYAIATVPTVDTFTVVTATGAGSGNVNIRSVLGGVDGFVASAAGTSATRLALDVILPRGLYGDGGGGVLATKVLTVQFEARRVDDDGLPLAGWIVLGTETFSDRTVTPLRRSLSYTLATAGRYRVRAFRINTKSGLSTEGHEILWGGLRAYLAETRDFGGVTLIAMRMRASNNLSAQASRKIAVLAIRKLPVWNGTVWSAPVATRSIAWAIAWAIADAARNTEFGARLADARLDLAALLALDAVWTARGDNFDGRFDQAATWWEAVSRIATAGRARLFMQGGRLRCVRDGPVAVPMALFSMRNIARDSFSIEYLIPSDETADSIAVSYFDATTWTPRRATATLPGGTALNPGKIDLFGVTNRSHAWREGMYQAAANRYRRRIVRFTTEMEGFIPSIGDLIAIQHDSTGWGAQAEAVAWDAATQQLTLSEPVTFGAGTHQIGLRSRTGGLSGPWIVTPGAAADIVVLAAAPDIVPFVAGTAERTHVVFGTVSTWRTLAKVTGTRPRGLYQIEIEAVTEDPSVHTAELGLAPAPIVTSSLPRSITRPVVGDLAARNVPGDTARVLLSWGPAPNAELYQIEMAEGADPADLAVSWTRVADTTASSIVLTLLHANRSLIQVRGVGLAAGPWRASAIGTLLGLFWLDDAAVHWGADASLYWRA